MEPNATMSGRSYPTTRDRTCHFCSKTPVSRGLFSLKRLDHSQREAVESEACAVNDQIQFFMDKAFGLVGLTVLGFLAKGWIAATESKLEALYQNHSHRISSQEDRINSIDAKYRDVLDILLGKFSAWEDRISNLLMKIPSDDPEKLRQEIEKFKAEAKSEIEVFRLQLVNMSHFEQKRVDMPSFVEYHKNIQNKINLIEQKISLHIKMLVHLNEKSKSFDQRLSNLSLIRQKKT